MYDICACHGFEQAMNCLTFCRFSARARAVMATLCPYDVAVAVMSSSRDRRLPRSSTEDSILVGPLRALGVGYRYGVLHIMS